ncbi:hypothetical protein LY632_03630 [Erythrobacter sp. SDW2]|uniref:hypothetical protein n=1 Tax=Erythrobacter sp. SDW2 TaxID=2907154 RepID=UPI001F2D0F8C|nr:hypothetical protein [Erythrobacter sp. SDW2]UIP07500.1 hypothetical protein LY632_03630 [Erythrobacter sp. SDW2]
MLHKFFEEGDWFAAKAHGYGAGLPIAWQGWVLLFAYAGAMIGIGLLIPGGGYAGLVFGLTGMALASVAFTLIVRRRTKGGWKWRP